MGQEVQCRARFAGRTSPGKALLETDSLIFRGEFRLRLPFQSLTSVVASGGELRLAMPEGPVVFELGAQAEKWARKILNPPSLLDKLGVKPGLSVRVPGLAGEAFLRDLARCATIVTRGPCDLVLLGAEKAGDLKRLSTLAKTIQSAGAVWVVYPKGVQHIREEDVMAAGKLAGLVDVKVASFSATHTALKFVIPVARRPLATGRPHSRQ